LFRGKIDTERQYGGEQNPKLESTPLAALFVYRDVRVREETWFRSWKAVDKAIDISQGFLFDDGMDTKEVERYKMSLYACFPWDSAHVVFVHKKIYREQFTMADFNIDLTFQPKELIPEVVFEPAGTELSAEDAKKLKGVRYIEEETEELCRACGWTTYNELTSSYLTYLGFECFKRGGIVDCGRWEMIMHFGIAQGTKE
jgi:hypothetical protein